MGMLNKKKKFDEGEIFLRWVNSRITKNKNVITATTGPTGSGKTYCDLRRAEIIHRFRFKEEFPIENVCFSVAELMKRISSGNLRRGEVLILEEAGVNIGSGDWQNKIVKMFNYVLQSFRSMNIALFMNLPVLGMLAKQARQLIHMHIETCGIEFENSILKVKPLVHQLNQHTGKSYWKYMRVKQNGRIVVIERMNFGLPSKILIDKYERKKSMFLADITQDFTNELRKLEQDKLDKIARKELSPVEEDAFEDECLGLTIKESALKRGKSQGPIWEARQRCRRKGYIAKNNDISLKKTDNIAINLAPIAYK